ncbi:MAG: SGNH/GDSL hydrolase family protein [Frankiaceae bacterium]|nr:SGNH/GDSL hydrolase family protein [Frankiaceae bacterium]
MVILPESSPDARVREGALRDGPLDSAYTTADVFLTSTARGAATEMSARRTTTRLLAAAVLLASAFALPAATSNANAPADSTVHALFFGDSLMYGTGARPTRPVMARVVARLLGWDITVDAVGGTGYTTGGQRGRPYLERLAKPGVLSTPYDVVLLEGGTNDKAADPATMRARATETVAYVRSRLPTAKIVLMGAYNPPGKRYDARRVTIDAILQTVAIEQQLPYVSPISGQWTKGQGARFLCPDGLHPSTYGYGVMGARLTTALRQAGVA